MKHRGELHEEEIQQRFQGRSYEPRASHHSHETLGENHENNKSSRVNDLVE
jgi:hypothetical protein